MKPFLFSALLALSLAACGQPAPEEEAATETVSTPTDTPAATASAAPAAFAQCGVCHSVKPDGKHGVGPNLVGVVGRKAGTAANYAYSPAMAASGLTWDEATLDAYLIRPMDAIKGTKMAYAGQGDPAKRKEIVAYLATLK